MFHIGTYCLAPYARTPSHIRDLADCGIDTVFSFPAHDRATLDLFAQYGVSAVVTDVVPSWWGGHGENAGTLCARHPLSEYEGASLLSHPAICGIDLGDEPSLLDFPHYGNIVRVLQEKFPKLWLYLNLYPNYAVLASNTPEEIAQQLGGSYAEHIRAYLSRCKLPYCSFDHYPYSSSMRLYFENLEIVSRACGEKKIDMYIVLQVNSHDQTKTLSTNMLRFQAFTALAYGARRITWACYTAGWWYHQVLDENGNRTEQYEKLKTVNHEILRAARELERRAWLGTAAAPFSKGAFSDVQGSSLLIGIYENALLLCNTSDPYDTRETESVVSFRCGGKSVRVIMDGVAQVPVPDESGLYTIGIRSSHAALVIAE